MIASIMMLGMRSPCLLTNVVVRLEHFHSFIEQADAKSTGTKKNRSYTIVAQDCRSLKEHDALRRRNTAPVVLIAVLLSAVNSTDTGNSAARKNACPLLLVAVE